MKLNYNDWNILKNQLNNIEKSLTNIFKKQEAVNKAALKFNKVYN